jgi:hypothetical protein
MALISLNSLLLSSVDPNFDALFTSKSDGLLLLIRPVFLATSEGALREETAFTFFLTATFPSALYMRVFIVVADADVGSVGCLGRGGVTRWFRSP